jgi:hypothetical protein
MRLALVGLGGLLVWGVGWSEGLWWCGERPQLPPKGKGVQRAVRREIVEN